MKLIEDAMRLLPVLGICLGAQLIENARCGCLLRQA